MVLYDMVGSVRPPWVLGDDGAEQDGGDQSEGDETDEDEAATRARMSSVAKLEISRSRGGGDIVRLEMPGNSTLGELFQVLQEQDEVRTIRCGYVMYEMASRRWPESSPCSADNVGSTVQVLLTPVRLGECGARGLNGIKWAGQPSGVQAWNTPIGWQHTALY